MSRSARTASLVALVTAGILALSGCSLLESVTGGGSGQQATRDSDEQVSEAGEVDVFTVKLGDCFNESDAEELYTVDALPCSDPHDYEIYYLFDMPDGEYPGEDAVNQAIEAGCGPQFDTFVGIAYADSVLDYWALYPTEGSWGAGDREIACVVWDTAPVEGTLKGAAR